MRPAAHPPREAPERAGAAGGERGPDGGWRVVLPVKGTAAAKSRLRTVTAQAPDLPLALARDALAAVLACPSVAGAWVVSADPAVLAALALPAAAGPTGPHLAGRVRAVPESAPGSGLLAAVADGVRAADQPLDLPPGGHHRVAEGWPGGRGGVAVLLADVPCLRPADLAEALAGVDAALRAGAVQACVPDAEGTGTVLLAARRAAQLTPRFGPASAAAHAAAGAVVLGGPARLRRDVDTPAELAEALTLGAGPATRAAVAGVSRAS